MAVQVQPESVEDTLKTHDGHSDKPAAVRLPSLMKTQKPSGPVSEMLKDVRRALLEGAITRILEANGVELKDDDVLSMTLNGKGELSINSNGSGIGGLTGGEIDGLCDTLSESLNEADPSDGRTLGYSLLELFAEDMGFDLNAARNNENFSISFSFRYNSKTDRNEIFGAKQTIINSLRFTSPADKKDETSDDETHGEERSAVFFNIDTKIE